MSEDCDGICWHCKLEVCLHPDEDENEEDEELEE